MSTNGSTSTASGNTSNKRGSSGQGGPKVRYVEEDDDLAAPLQSVELRAGQYPARLVGFGKKGFMYSKFSGQEEARRDSFWVVKNPKFGSVHKVKFLFAPPSNKGQFGGRKSNVYKMLKPLKTDKPLWDGSTDSPAQGIGLIDFVGGTCFVTIENDEEGFSKIVSFNPAPEGLDDSMFPTMEEGKAAFEEPPPPAEAGEDKGHIPF